jgi:hypothetical protein
LKIFEEKVLLQIFLKSFLLKIFDRFSEEIQRRSSEELDLVKIFVGFHSPEDIKKDLGLGLLLGY